MINQMIDQACPEWRGDLATYLIGALDPQARTAFRLHLASCLACRAEYDELFGIERPKMVEVVSWAASDDSRSLS